MKFVNFVGNERVKEQLTYLKESGRLPHAFVIEGEEGLGKRTLAKEIVLNLFCKADEKPCFNCPQCSKVLKGVHPLLDDEAVKVVSASPDWKAARDRGKKVKCGMSLYVEFKLERNK